MEQLPKTSTKEQTPNGTSVRIGQSPTIVGEFGVIALKNFKPSDILFIVRGPIVPSRTIYTFQCGPNEHIDPVTEDGRPNFGHFLNHSCDPNASIKVAQDTKGIYIEVSARKPIAADGEISVDYGSMEFDTIASEKDCRCDSPNCRGKILGYKDLPLPIRQQYLDEGLIPNYLLAEIISS